MLRLSEEEGLKDQVEDHRQAALREEEELRSLIQQYTETYGEQLIRHGDAEFAVEGLIAVQNGKTRRWSPCGTCTIFSPRGASARRH